MIDNSKQTFKNSAHAAANVNLTLEQTVRELEGNPTSFNKNILDWYEYFQHQIREEQDRLDSEIVKRTAILTAEAYVKSGTNPTPLTSHNGRVVSVQWLAKQKALSLLTNPQKLEELSRQNNLNIIVQKLLPDAKKRYTGALTYIPWKVDDWSKVDFSKKTMTPEETVHYTVTNLKGVSLHEAARPNHINLIDVKDSDVIRDSNFSNEKSGYKLFPKRKKLLFINCNLMNCILPDSAKTVTCNTAHVKITKVPGKADETEFLFKHETKERTLKEIEGRLKPLLEQKAKNIGKALKIANEKRRKASQMRLK